MQLQSIDTSKQFEEIYINLLRKKTVAQKIEQVVSISSFVIGLSKKAIIIANPALSKREQDFLFVKLHYGDALYFKLKRFLEEEKIG